MRSAFDVLDGIGCSASATRSRRAADEAATRAVKTNPIADPWHRLKSCSGLQKLCRAVLKTLRNFRIPVIAIIDPNLSPALQRFGGRVTTVE